jgi:hypothetical protein
MRAVRPGTRARLGVLRWAAAGVVVLLACAGAWAWLARGGATFSYESDVRYLEQELNRLGSVAAIQTWLLRNPEGPVRDLMLTDVTEWPACFRALRALRVLDAENGGVCLKLGRGLTLIVYPHGKRPKKNTYRPTASRRAYLGTFGEDAYIAKAER